MSDFNKKTIFPYFGAASWGARYIQQPQTDSPNRTLPIPNNASRNNATDRDSQFFGVVFTILSSYFSKVYARELNSKAFEMNYNDENGEFVFYLFWTPDLADNAENPDERAKDFIAKLRETIKDNELYDVKVQETIEQNTRNQALLILKTNNKLELMALLENLLVGYNLPRFASLSKQHIQMLNNAFLNDNSYESLFSNPIYDLERARAMFRYSCGRDTQHAGHHLNH
jgi:hypothetical protein